MSHARERLTRLVAPAAAALGELRRDHLIWFPVAAGFFWTGESARAYPADYIFVPDLSILVVQIAKTQSRLFGGTENFSVTKLFKEIAEPARREELLHCLFAISSADDSISVVEENVPSWKLYWPAMPLWAAIRPA